MMHSVRYKDAAIQLKHIHIIVREIPFSLLASYVAITGDDMERSSFVLADRLNEIPIL